MSSQIYPANLDAIFNPTSIAVVGATGAVGDRIVDVLAETPGWKVVGLCRNPPEEKRPNVRFIRADLMDPESCRAAVREARTQAASPPLLLATDGHDRGTDCRGSECVAR